MEEGLVLEPGYPRRKRLLQKLVGGRKGSILTSEPGSTLLGPESGAEGCPRGKL